MRFKPETALALVLTLASSSALATDGEYQSARHEIEEMRQSLGRRLARARTERQRKKLLEEGSAFLLRAITIELAPHWYGTPWAFSGLSNTPGEGAIACGTFVATLLRHAGFQLDRVQMGRLASEHIALSLTRESQLRRYRRRPVEEVVADVVAWGPGLYMIGLDNHAALAVVDDAGDAWLLHSSYVGTGAVVKEALGGPNPFSASRYRVVARLLDAEMVQGWLEGRTFEARSDHRRAPG